MNKTYFLLGSNMGNNKQQLKDARKHISIRVGKIIRTSHLYQTAAWGNEDQPDFINQVIVVETNLNALDCLHQNLQIETAMGRIRSVKNAPRVIDIDILYFDKEIIDHPDLKVPHPALQLRRFVLTPLNELSPNFLHPVLGKTNHQLLKICKDTLDVKKI